MRKIFFLPILYIGLCICPTSFISAQGVGVNPLGNAPDSSAMMDISSSSKGLLIPRVALQSTTDALTVPSPAVSLLVFNTNTGMTGGSVGYWYWDGTVWTKLSTGGAAIVSCPSGFTSVNASYCIETNERTAATFVTAYNICGNIAPGAHMCSLSEWHTACSTASGLSNMTNNFEWVDEMDSGQNNFSFTRALVIGSGGCGAGSNQMNINNAAIANTNVYRCCFSK